MNPSLFIHLDLTSLELSGNPCTAGTIGDYYDSSDPELDKCRFDESNVIGN